MIRVDDTAAKSYSPSWGSVRKGTDRRIIALFIYQNLCSSLHFGGSDPPTRHSCHVDLRSVTGRPESSFLTFS